jgi:hypothetical protein
MSSITHQEDIAHGVAVAGCYLSVHGPRIHRVNRYLQIRCFSSKVFSFAE